MAGRCPSTHYWDSLIKVCLPCKLSCQESKVKRSCTSFCASKCNARADHYYDEQLKRCVSCADVCQAESGGCPHQCLTTTPVAATKRITSALLITPPTGQSDSSHLAAQITPPTGRSASSTRAPPITPSTGQSASSNQAPQTTTPPGHSASSNLAPLITPPTGQSDSASSNRAPQITPPNGHSASSTPALKTTPLTGLSALATLDSSLLLYSLLALAIILLLSSLGLALKVYLSRAKTTPSKRGPICIHCKAHIEEKLNKPQPEEMQLGREPSSDNPSPTETCVCVHCFPDLRGPEQYCPMQSNEQPTPQQIALVNYGTTPWAEEDIYTSEPSSAHWT